MWVCSTHTACGAVRWTREWMKNAVGSTVLSPSSTLPSASHSTSEEAVISDQCQP